MRTTLDIDDDVLRAAKELARAEKKTAGQVISELVRQALVGEAGSREAAEDYVIKNGWVVLRSRGRVVTDEEIERVKGELDREEIEDALALGHQRAARADE